MLTYLYGYVSDGDDQDAYRRAEQRAKARPIAGRSIGCIQSAESPRSMAVSAALTARQQNGEYDASFVGPRLN